MLVSPSGPVRTERVAAGVALLEGWGLVVRHAPGTLDRHGYLAGLDDARLSGLNGALRDPKVRAVICTRGGYGAQRIVDGLDATALRDDPKLLVGFSDITALQLAAWRHGRLASVYAPMAAWSAERTGAASAESLRAAIMSTADVVLQARSDEETSGVRVTGPAVAGALIGGNLCMIASTIGTPDMPDLHGAILLIEDVDEPPYKVDRMLTQLRRSGALDGIVGVAVGQFTRCSDGWQTTIVDVLLDRLGDLGVPMLGGLPVGHGRDQLSVPVGVPATLDVGAGILTATPAVR
ncbi:MAG TPA: LD-carboxypeptidase [Micromonosporaceae bacterium]|jgi:muramoyltetrapeptide carboxypeptidase|nr:LD-carboxypeptidase [Micromonosporaceae bacterium]